MTDYCGCCGKQAEPSMGPCPNTADGLHSWQFPNPTPEQEKEYAAQLARAQQARNELRILAMSPESIRRRAKRRLIKLVIGYAGLVLACWYLGYTVYTFWH